MRYLLLAVAILLANPSLGCTITRIIPAELQGKSAEEVDQYFLGQSFRSAAIVLEATVMAVDHRRGFDLLRIRSETFWKTDGKPVELVYQQPLSLCHQNDLELGSRYIVFANRKVDLLESVRASSTPLSVSDMIFVSSVSDARPTQADTDTNSDISRVRFDLAEIAVLWVLPSAQK